MNLFFIIGLPRSRTAWLANFLTNGNSFCFHELMRSCANIGELEVKLTEALTRYETVGDADPALATMLPQVMAQFPEAKVVFIRRDVDEAYESFQKAFPKLSVPYPIFKEADKMIEFTKQTISAERESQCIEVDAEKLDEQSTCDQIHNFCLGRMTDMDRLAMLQGWRVTAIAEKAAVTLAPWARYELIRQSQPLSAIDREWEALCRDMTQGNAQFGLAAFDWLMDIKGIALTWDHIMDGDSINVLTADKAFEAMLLKWPLNGFFLKHAVVLGPVLCNAVAAWRHGGRARHFDCYSEPALAVAYALGGVEHANRFAARVHELVRRGRRENDSRDLDDSPSPLPSPAGRGSLPAVVGAMNGNCERTE